MSGTVPLEGGAEGVDDRRPVSCKRNSDENRVDPARGFSVAGLARRAAGQPTVLAGVRRQPAADVIGSNRQYDTLRIVTIFVDMFSIRACRCQDWQLRAEQRPAVEVLQ
jgi:hypothetical protein